MVETRELACLINQGFIGAYFCTLATFGAKGFNESHLRVRRDTFGVAAPLAFKAASFQEHYCSYTRSVMD
jgi:hypothetical protein